MEGSRGRGKEVYTASSQTGTEGQSVEGGHVCMEGILWGRTLRYRKSKRSTEAVPVTLSQEPFFSFPQGALEIPVFAKPSAGVQPEGWSGARVRIGEGL